MGLSPLRTPSGSCDGRWASLQNVQQLDFSGSPAPARILLDAIAAWEILERWFHYKWKGQILLRFSEVPHRKGSSHRRSCSRHTGSQVPGSSHIKNDYGRDEMANLIRAEEVIKAGEMEEGVMAVTVVGDKEEEGMSEIRREEVLLIISSIKALMGGRAKEVAERLGVSVEGLDRYVRGVFTKIKKR